MHTRKIVESKDFDFIGMQTTIAEFAFRNGIPGDIINRLSSMRTDILTESH